MEVDSSIAIVFRCFEDFLRKAGSLNVFETLVYNYKLKEELLHPTQLASFSSILNELIQNLSAVRGEMLKPNTELKQNGIDYMIALDNSTYLPIIGEEELKNVSVVVAGELQTLFSVKLEQQQQVQQVQQNGVQTQEVNEEKCSELYMIPILKEVREEDELSVKDICSLMGTVAEQQPAAAEEAAPLQADTPRQKMKKKKKKSPIATISLPVKQTTNTTPEDDSVLMFFCCDKCFHSFRTEERFINHKCTAKGGGKNSTLIRENAGLRRMKKFVCGLCLEEYRNLDRISFHLKRCEGGPFTCEMCPSTAPQFSTMKSLNFHKIHEHKEERSFICRDCGFPFKFKCSLQKHKLRAHNTELQPRTFPCDSCGSVFLKKIFLTNHKLKSHGVAAVEKSPQPAGGVTAPPKAEEPHPAASEEETEEEPVQDSSHPHSCSVCGKSFAKRSKLQDHHGRRHSASSELLQCPHCPKAFRTRKDLRQHVRRMHGGQVLAEEHKKKKKAKVENGGGGPSSTSSKSSQSQGLDFMEALTPNQLEQIMRADFLVPTLIP